MTDSDQKRVLDKNQFARIIRKRRKELGLKQKQLAKKAGVASITISRFERALRMPRYDNLINILSALEIDPTEDFYKDIMTRESDEEPSALECADKIIYYANELKERLEKLLGK